MRTTVIPAQITTVEDTIAGNLNLTQLLILMVPVFWAALVFAILPTPMHLTWYKVGLMFLVLVLCVGLSLRIKGKVVLNWLMVLATYKLRPRFYVFDKNDTYLRNIFLPVIEKRHSKPLLSVKKVSSNRAQEALATPELVLAESYLTNRKFSVSFKARKKGGLHVAFEPSN